MEKYFKISVITINYNNCSGLRKTIESVLSQSLDQIEYLIIDGNSTDGSKEILTEFKNKIDYILSESDKGIYDAMNKGIIKANGEYLLFLNSGDYFYSNDSLYNLLDTSDGENIIYGDIVMVKGQTTWTKTHPNNLTFKYFLNNSLPHPASLIKRCLFEKNGLYNVDNKIVSDWEFFMNAICLFGCTYKYVPFPVAVFNQDGVSSSLNSQSLIIKEKEKVLLTNYSAFLPDYKELEEFTSAINNIKNSRLHSFVDKLLKSSLYNFLKGIS